MDSEWRSYRVGDVAEVFDGPHATPKRTDSGPVFLGISSLASGRLRLEESSHISEDDYIRWTKRVTPRPGDVVFSYETRLGEAALIPQGLRCCLGRRMGLLRPNDSVADARFLLYAYLGPEFQETLRRHTVRGSTVERILLTELPDLPILLPSLDEQRRIASILGALDDKIELNRRMSRTLDEAAQAIFNSWFISAVEVKCPSARLGDVVAIVRDAVNPATVCSATCYVALKHFDGGCTSLTRWGTAPDATSGKSRFLRGDILFGKLRPYFHKVAVAPSDGICSTDIMVLRPKSELLSGFVLGHVNREAFIGYVTARSDGTRMPRAKWADIADYPVALPPQSLVEAYERVSSPMIRRQRALTAESHRLADLREALLPPLMSGRVGARAGVDV